MRFILPLAIAGALGACTLTSTFENPNCERYWYLDACQGGEGAEASDTSTPPGSTSPGLGNPGNAKDVGRAGEDPPDRGGMNSPEQGGPGTRGASDGDGGKGGEKG